MNKENSPKYRATQEEKRKVIDRLAKRIKDHSAMQGERTMRESYEKCRETAANWIADYERRKPIRTQN